MTPDLFTARRTVLVVHYDKSLGVLHRIEEVGGTVESMAREHKLGRYRLTVRLPAQAASEFSKYEEKPSPTK